MFWKDLWRNAKTESDHPEYSSIIKQITTTPSPTENLERTAEDNLRMNFSLELEELKITNHLDWAAKLTDACVCADYLSVIKETIQPPSDIFGLVASSFRSSQGGYFFAPSFKRLKRLARGVSTFVTFLVSTCL